jgi:Domain of unknown function (DUF3511)
MERRSKSYADNRCTSLSCAWSPPIQNALPIQNEEKPQLKRGNSLKVFTNPDFQRKRRVMSYKAISYRSEVKGSIKGSFKWIKEKCMKVAHGWW